MASKSGLGLAPALVVHHSEPAVGRHVETVDVPAQQQPGVEQGLDVQLALRGLEAGRVLEGEVALQHRAAGREPRVELRPGAVPGVREQLSGVGLLGPEPLPGGQQQLPGLLGRAPDGREVEELLEHPVHHGAAHGIRRRRLGQPVDGAEAVPQRTGQEVGRPTRGERPQHVDAVDRGGDPLGRRRGRRHAHGRHPRRARRQPRAARARPHRRAVRPRRIASRCAHPRVPPAATPARHLQGRHHRGQRRPRVVVVVHRGGADRRRRVAAGGGRPARSRRPEVRRGVRVRRRALPLRAAARGLARADGAALRVPRHLDHAALPRRDDPDRGRGPPPAPGVLDRRGRPAHLAGDRWGRARPAAARAAGPAADGRGGPRGGQPPGGRAQPRPRAAAGRRPRAQGRRLGPHRQRPPGHRRRRVGRPGRRRGGARLAPAPEPAARRPARAARLRAGLRRGQLPVGRGDLRDGLGPAPREAAAPGRPRPGPAYPRRPRRPAARRRRCAARRTRRPAASSR